ncbi:MAG TPA: HAD family hydrolase [Treponemataceae bacterium]|nr:HAD family hydrolase [Treponemataceae bacterium]
MTIYRIPTTLSAIIFDIDATLYTHADYVKEQTNAQIRQFAKTTKMSMKKARSLINSYQKEWSKVHGGATMSLANTLADLGIPIEQTIEWRKKLLHPEAYLSKDTELEKTMKQLAEKYTLLCLTNNPVRIGRRTLAALGIDCLISEIIGLDTTHISKPARKPFELAVQRAGCAVENCLSVGDRYSIDIALPLEMGMGGILVDSVSEVYTISTILEASATTR